MDEFGQQTPPGAENFGAQPETSALPQEVVQPESQPSQERKWDKKDILAGTDTKSVLEAYHNALKNNGRFDRADLQSTVGERLVQLGDVEHGMQFTLLGEQTRNSERMQASMEAYSDITGRLDRSMDNFEDHTRSFDRTVDKLEEPMRTFSSAASRIEDLPQQMTRSAGMMSEATENFGRAASRMEGVAEVINNASYRMQG